MRCGEIVLIGPVCAGKSVVGDLLSEALRIPHTDLDHVAGPYYAEAEWSVERFRAIEREAGLMAAYLDGEPAMIHALERMLDGRPEGIVSLGAAHSHYASSEHLGRARRALKAFDHVVLLLPSPDPARSVATLRERCRVLGLREWRDDSVDLIEVWVTGDCNRTLATVTVYTDGRSPEQTRDDVLAAVRSDQSRSAAGSRAAQE